MIEEKELKKRLRFKTFIDFCDRADELRDTFAVLNEYDFLDVRTYKKYIYNQHKFSNIPERDMMLKDKCWTWLLSYKYEPMSKNDLYSVLGYIKKE